MYIPSSVSSDVASVISILRAKDDQPSQWSSLVGIVTAIVGNVLISFALNIQRYAHIHIDQDYTRKKQERKARKKLPRALRGYGTAVQQAQIAEERARLHATVPGPGLDEEEDDDTSSDASESSPLNKSFHPSSANEPPQNAENNAQGGRKSYLQSPYWWLGITLMTIGEAGNFLAYGFAPASIVSPLGVVALISNCLIAPLMLKERFRKRDFWGVLVAVGGAVTIVLSARMNEAKMGPDKLWHTIKRWEFLTYVCITVALIIILMVASPYYGRRTILIDLGLVGLFGGYTALSTKGVAAMLSDTLFRAFTYPITYLLVAVLIASAVMQIRYINRALSNFNSTQVIPTQFVLFTLSVIIGSAVLYRDFEKTDVQQAIKFIAGCLLTFSGVWLITSGRKNNDDDDDDDYHEDGTIRLIDEEQVPEPNPSQKSGRTDSIDVNGKSINHKTSLSTTSELNSTPIPSVSFTPNDSTSHLNGNAHDSQAHVPECSARPQTPRQLSQLSVNMETPFFTPSSAPATNLQRLKLGTTNSDSALVTPETPIRQGRTDPSQPVILLHNNDVGSTPSAGLLRSARGSIQRLIPAPLIPPLPGALTTLVAESLLKGEGSPKFYKKSIRRRRSLRHRHTVASQDPMVPQSAIESPPISRWNTTDSDVPETPQTAISEYIASSDDPNTKRKRSRLGSFGDTLSDFFKKSKHSDRDANE